VGLGTYCFSHGRQQSNEEHCKEQVIVRADTVREGLFELAHENSRLEALHVQWELTQLEVRLPPSCQQNSFDVIKWLILFIACIDRVQNVLKDLLGQVGKSIGVLELL
jgi:hypothetical protein